LTTRGIVPFALADSGLRWHVRAFDRRSGEFRDFILNRFGAARILSGPVADHEKPDQDIQWNWITELELVPHPVNVQHPDIIEAEYGMDGGALKVRTRAAMAGYLLRRWNVDCTEDHSLKGDEYQLWLRNHQALYGVANLALVPGCSESMTKWAQQLQQAGCEASILLIEQFECSQQIRNRVVASSRSPTRSRQILVREDDLQRLAYPVLTIFDRWPLTASIPITRG